MRPAAILQLHINPDLKERLGQEADDAGLSMNELVSKVFADRYGDPKLAVIPRKPMGRPRKRLAETTHA